jgi:trehalose 2-sulfotransferase
MSTAAKRRRAEQRRRQQRRAARPAKLLVLRIAASLGLDVGLAKRGYVICGMPRSGSTYLCQLLGSTGVLGRPIEFFNTEARKRTHGAAYPADPRAQLFVIRSLGATDNGTYGVKLLHSHLRFFPPGFDPFDGLPHLHVVRLSRRDILGQAISLARAEQTGQWGILKSQRGTASYQPDHIRKCLSALAEQREYWDRTVERLGRDPVSLDYETVVQNPQRAVDCVAALMGVPGPTPIDISRISAGIQRDELNEEWRARFLAETSDEFRHLAG